ncbi:hypothetical protein FISHEDRAFT_61759 [Fistulina hepatica ATCC 64428]|uniref:C2H2-type domain-containing protein n=1 Tax=Fistulina hepatica ATCC 64428 TaxID=1128425 RepID=A0A0D7A1N6_9AGAR|nr:hypothetical protein FISHEDRAFT_61759 [Fistulina hepatica ATCC 64428]
MASTFSASQPIAFANAHHGSNNVSASPGQDYPMASASFTGSSGSFNPASYAKHLLGSPLSWTPATSFGGRILAAGSPTAKLLSSVDRFSGQMSSSVESISVMNALSVFDREGELCRNYTCCGLHLNDLHALLEHFEEVHIITNNPAQIGIPFNPISHPPAQQSSFPSSPSSSQPAYSVPFDPDDMDLDSVQPASESSSSPQYSGTSSPPPDTPVPAPLDAYNPQNNYVQPYSNPYSQPPSPGPFGAKPHLNISTATFFGFGASTNPNNYDTTMTDVTEGETSNQGVPPSLLFGTSTSKGSKGVSKAVSLPTTPLATTPVPRASPATGLTRSNTAMGRQSGSATPVQLDASSSNVVAPSKTTSGSVSTLLSNISSKPFKCPKPNCNKSYKQANGLKYHMTHGSCNFAPAKEVEHVKDLLLERRRQQSHNPNSPLGPSAPTSNSSTPETSTPGTPSGRARDVDLSTSPSLEGLTEADILSLSREAEKRLRPFACGVGDCQRRYKNMNGLRYHYQHSGDHGAIGLRMLAGGVHECLSLGGKKSNVNSRANTPPNPVADTASPVPQQSRQQSAPQQSQQQQSYHQQQPPHYQSQPPLPHSTAHHQPQPQPRPQVGMVQTTVFSPKHTPNSSYVTGCGGYPPGGPYAMGAGAYQHVYAPPHRPQWANQPSPQL